MGRKTALNAVAITFSGWITPDRQLTNAKVGSTVNLTAPGMGPSPEANTEFGGHRVA
jgi:hypothetical protein